MLKQRLGEERDGRQSRSEPNADYEATGRTGQKARTRAALVDATRRLMGEGTTPTVEEAAAAAGVGRTTAYRYFPTQDALVRAAHPQLDAASLLGPDPPTDVTARFERVLTEQLRIVREWEPQLRASLRLSLEPGAARSPLRGGRAVGWFVDALAPLADARPDLDLRQLAVHVRSVVGIEPFVWLRDVAGLGVDDAVEVMRANARFVLSGLLADTEGSAPTTQIPENLR